MNLIERLKTLEAAANDPTSLITERGYVAEVLNVLPKLLAVVEAAKWQKYVSEQSSGYLCQDLENALAALEK